MFTADDTDAFYLKCLQNNSFLKTLVYALLRHTFTPDKVKKKKRVVSHYKKINKGNLT